MFKFQKKIILNKENHHINSHSILKLFIFIQVKCFQQEKKDDIRNLEWMNEIKTVIYVLSASKVNHILIGLSFPLQSQNILWINVI